MSGPSSDNRSQVPLTVTEYSSGLNLADYVLDPQIKISGPELLRKLENFCKPPVGSPEDWNPESQLDPSAVAATRARLIHILLTEDSKLAEVARKLFTVSDFLEITRNLITTDEGIGRVGGKMAGTMIFLRALTINEVHAKTALGLELEPDPHPDRLPLVGPQAHSITAQDVFEKILSFNHLGYLRREKWKSPDEIQSDQEGIVQSFKKQLKFPLDIETKLREFVAQAEGQGPFIARSSSLLEDSTKAPFSGIYQSVVWSNQGTFEERLAELKSSVGEVYASTFSYNALEYRRRFKDLGLLEAEEEMGISIQRMVGERYGRYFFPVLSGVGMSFADRIPTPQHSREEGVTSLALGYGVAIVDQAPGNPVREIYLCQPKQQLSATCMGEPQKNCQRYVFVVDLEEPAVGKRFKRVDFFDLQKELAFSEKFFEQVISTESGGRLYSGVREGGKFITMDGLAKEGILAEKIAWIFRRLKTVFEEDVDIEFACDGKKLTLLQGRSEMRYAEGGPVVIPKDIAPANLLFRVSNEILVPTQALDELRYVVLVRPEAYHNLTSQSKARSVVESEVSEIVRAIRILNQRAVPKSYILMSPGQLGTNIQESASGLPVVFGDIDNAGLLVELLSHAQPNSSNGRHWWAALKQLNLHIFPLPLHRDGASLNDKFFTGSNALIDFVDQALFSKIEHVVHVVDIAKLTAGRSFLKFRGNSKELMAVAHI